MSEERANDALAGGADRDWVLVWLDSREAIVVSMADGAPVVARLRSDVPPHRRSTGHVRHDPSVRHGGGGEPQTAGDPRRIEHLARFLDTVAERLPAKTNVLAIGPGVVPEHLVSQVAAADEKHGLSRTVRFEAAGRLTKPQLIARLHELRGEPTRRRTVGGHRWTGIQPRRPSGGLRPPRAVVEKVPRDRRPPG